MNRTFVLAVLVATGCTPKSAEPARLVGPTPPAGSVPSPSAGPPPQISASAARVAGSAPALPTSASAPLAAVASAIAPAPSAPSASAAFTPSVDLGPEVDCTAWPQLPPPSPRSLCEWAMGDHPERWVDARGFAMVTDYSLPTPVWPEEFWHIKKRLCGAAAARALPRLLFNIRFSLSFEHDFGTKLLKCAGASCGVSGIGEWSTHTQITFRVVPGGLALDTWSEYSSDIQPDLIAKSRAFIAKGLAELATARCAP